MEHIQRNRYKCVFISDFNLEPFAGCLSNNREVPVETIIAPFGQVVPVLMQKELECWRRRPDFTVIWTQPEKIIDSFNRVLNHKQVPIEEILEEVDKYSSLILGICDRVGFVFVPIWGLPSYYNSFGMLDMKFGTGISAILMQMNLRLSENLSRAANICLFNTRRWIEAAGGNAFNPKLWYMGKIAFANRVFIEAAEDVVSAIQAIRGNSKKLIILDLDNTLWGGMVGEAGWENIRLGGHDHIGEAYVDFQRALKSLTNRGILLGIASKNDEAVALEAIEKHPSMVLRPDDFAGWRINWQDKAQNILELVSELNLTLNSTVFIDDSPFERARVKEALPDVFVPEWVEDKMLYRKKLLRLRCFNAPSISREDASRAGMYVSERKRRDLKAKIGSVNEWLEGLGIRVEVKGLSRGNLQRAAQLLNKTNQMNLTTRRMTEPELAEWAGEDNRKLWTFSVSDKFGDSGLTGIVSLEIINNSARIRDFVLSCRVIGRKIEETMLYVAAEYARCVKIDEITAEYFPTSKNKPCLEFFRRSGFDSNGGTVFTWPLDRQYNAPHCIEIINGAGESDA